MSIPLFSNQTNYHDCISVNNTCPSDQALIEGRCYKIHTWPRLLWDYARLDCESNGGYLAIIDTTEKLQQVSSLLLSDSSEYIFHIGLVRDLSIWSWFDGTPVDISLFEVGYPKSTAQDETCLAFHGFYPSIVNVPCNSRFGYACEAFEGMRKFNWNALYLFIFGFIIQHIDTLPKHGHKTLNVRRSA